VYDQSTNVASARQTQRSLWGKKSYAPKTIGAAWENHFEAFGAQDLDKIMLDYDDDSVTRVFNNIDKKKSEYKGVVEIRNMFRGLFESLPDLSTLAAPVVDIDEAGEQVFLVWECPGVGYKTATDSFLYKKKKGKYVISRQNIVVTYEQP
jgi:ketosteroid isomerase-like protein